MELILGLQRLPSAAVTAEPAAFISIFASTVPTAPACTTIHSTVNDPACITG